MTTEETKITQKSDVEFQTAEELYFRHLEHRLRIIENSVSGIQSLETRVTKIEEQLMEDSEHND